MHSTNNISDGYLGSGKRIKRSLKKYGKDNFKFEILEFTENRKMLIEREIAIVNSDVLKDKLCLNLKEGGCGGLCNETHSKNFHAAGGRKVREYFREIHANRMKNDAEYHEKWKIAYKNAIGSRKGDTNPFYGRKHDDEWKKTISDIMRVKQSGTNNSQYNTCWITNEIENRKIKKDEIVPVGWRFGRNLKILKKQ
jgi:group I intron endonuclease